MKDTVMVRPMNAQDTAAWREMWQGYCLFYDISLPASVTETTWKRLLDPASPVKALLAIDSEGNTLGFANYVLHLYTWSEKPACLLEDLFVRPQARKQGVGRSLIEYLIRQAQTLNWGRLYWMTRESNRTARRLYDHFGKSDGFVRYCLSFDDAQPRSEQAD